MKTKITLKVMEKRIAKQLSKDNQSLHTSKVRKRTIESLGPYYIVNDITNSITARGINPDQLVKMGEEMGVLSDWEMVETKDR